WCLATWSSLEPVSDSARSSTGPERRATTALFSAGLAGTLCWSTSQHVTDKTRSRGVDWQAAGDGGDDMASDKRAAMKVANQHSMAWIAKGRKAAVVAAQLVQASGNGIIAWVMRSETLGLMTVSCL
ncbi:hypothetical protein RB213_011345, partial [Colletotrichum asianum]